MFESLLHFHHWTMGANRDPFREFRFNPNSIEDIQKFEDYTEALRSMTKMCFKKCSDFSFSEYTKYEETCMKTCYKDILKSHEKMLTTSNEITSK